MINSNTVLADSDTETFSPDAVWQCYSRRRGGGANRMHRASGTPCSCCGRPIVLAVDTDIITGSVPRCHFWRSRRHPEASSVSEHGILGLLSWDGFDPDAMPLAGIKRCITPAMATIIYGILGIYLCSMACVSIRGSIRASECQTTMSIS